MQAATRPGHPPTTRELGGARREQRTLMAERIVLGGLLLRAGQDYIKVRSRLDASDFLDEFHAALFVQMGRCLASGEPLEPALLGERTAAMLPPDRYPGLPYLRRIAAIPEANSAIDPYVDIVLEHALRRTLARQMREYTAQLVESDGTPAAEVLSRMLSELTAIEAHASASRAETFGSMGQYARKALDQIQEVADRDDPDGVLGVRTGFPALDQELQGLARGDLIVLAARPSMGKTALALNIAEHVAIREDLPVAIFSLEMSGEGLAMRVLSAGARVDGRRLRRGDLQDHEWSTLVEAIDQVERSPQWVDTTSVLTLEDMRRRCRDVVARSGKPLGLVVVDYLQLVAAQSKHLVREREVAEVTRTLKALAKEMDAPVLALAQLNRSLESRPDRRPILADLRESGAIEQDADTILFLYRDEIYNPESPHRGHAEVIVAKQRNGPIGVVRLRFDNALTRFEAV